MTQDKLMEIGDLLATIAQKAIDDGSDVPCKFALVIIPYQQPTFVHTNISDEYVARTFMAIANMLADASRETEGVPLQ